jgi:hypothetical protein
MRALDAAPDALRGHTRTLYEIGLRPLQGPPSGENYRDLLAAGERLAFVTVRIAGIDALTGEPGIY